MALSNQHRAALKEGRQQAAAIRRYLDTLQARKPGRPVTADTLRRRLSRIDEQLAAEANPLKVVELEQRRIDAENALAAATQTADVEALEAGFVKHAKAYSERKGISYAAWRAGGVPAAVLKKAGVGRGS